jgi:hypothetical protein
VTSPVSQRLISAATRCGLEHLNGTLGGAAIMVHTNGGDFWMVDDHFKVLGPTVYGFAVVKSVEPQQ